LPYDRSKYVKSRAQDNSAIINLASWKEGDTTQTNPPVRPISCQYPSGNFPIGQIFEYANEHAYRLKDDDMIKKDLFLDEQIRCLRQSAEVHRQVRKYAQTIARPGIKMVDLCKNLETVLRNVIEADGIKAGQAFPTGCSLNHVAAHYTPNYGDNTVLRKCTINQNIMMSASLTSELT
jgi:methionyl aminopeptidase